MLIIEIFLGIIAGVFFILGGFLIPLLIEAKRSVKKIGSLTCELEKCIEELSEPTYDLLANSSALVEDIKTKSEDLNVLFQPLHRMRTQGPKEVFLESALKAVPLIIKLKESITGDGKKTASKHKKRASSHGHRRP
jgi:Bacterial protein of unknown function (DUF948)